MTDNYQPPEETTYDEDGNVVEYSQKFYANWDDFIFLKKENPHEVPTEYDRSKSESQLIEADIRPGQKMLMEGVLSTRGWPEMLKYIQTEIKEPHEIVSTENDGLTSYTVWSA